jgi:hypothetical protein
VGALSQYLESEGIPTTQISLVREHTEAIKPPRALWVPFVLGRPFGAPGDAVFQTKVVLAALNLLEAPSGPVLADFPEDAPHTESAESFVCPVSFGADEAKGDLGSDLQREIAELATWHALTRQKRGRSTVGLTGQSPAQVGKFLSDFAANPSTPSYKGDVPISAAVRLAAHDIRAYYLESVASQPGARAAAEAEEWFWLHTAAGRTLFKVREVCNASSDEALKRYGLRGVPTRFTPA